MERKFKVYLGGALFSEAEITQRLLEAKILREKFGEKIEVFNPIEQPFNKDKNLKLPTPEEIFKGDYEAIKQSDFLICDITREDPGLMAELGLAFELNKYIIAIDSDIRRASANKYDFPSYSINHFVLGLIQEGGNLVYNFNEAVTLLGKILCLEKLEG